MRPALLVALALALLCASVARADGATDVDLRFTQAEFAPANDALPPAEGWMPLALPHAWRTTHRGLDGFGWYRVRFHLDAAPRRSLALLVAKVAVTGEVRVNGSVLNPDVRFVGVDGYAGTQMTNFSLLLPVPSGLLRPGDNELLVRVQGDPLTGGFIAPMRLASHETLRGPFLLRHILQRIVPQALLALTLATLAFALIVWWRERRVSHREFVVVMALWTSLLVGYLIPVPPVTRPVLALVFATLFVAYNWALLGLLWRLS